MISSNIAASSSRAAGVAIIPLTVVPSAAVSGPAVAAMASFVQMTTSASGSTSHGSPAAVSAPVRSSTPSGIARLAAGGPSWVTDDPLDVIGDTSITPGSGLCAPAVVVPGSTRSGPSTSASASSLPSPFCSVATHVAGPTACRIDVGHVAVGPALAQHDHRVDRAEVAFADRSSRSSAPSTLHRRRDAARAHARVTASMWAASTSTRVTSWPARASSRRRSTRAHPRPRWRNAPPRAALSHDGVAVGLAVPRVRRDPGGAQLELLHPLGVVLAAARP